MPRSEQMSWEGKPNFRWVRMFKGIRYRVTCDELQVPRNKEQSQAAANAWWLRKKAEIDGTPDADPVLVLTEQFQQERLETLLTNPLFQEVSEYAIAKLEPRAQTPDRSVRACGESFLAVVRGSMKPRSYEELAAYIHSLSNVPDLLAGEADVGVFNEDFVEKTYLALREAKRGDKKLSEGRKKKHWSFFKRFVAYLGEKKLIPTPSNLYSKTFKFKVPTQEVKQYPLAEVRRVLKGLKPRLRLYALLGLNCGMTNTDLAGLKKSEVNLKAGSITRRRTKTGDHDSVPVVRYKLWPETLKLLRKHQSTYPDHPELFLTNMRGNPLCGTRIEEGKARRYDQVVQQWRRAEPGIPLKAFRSIAATLVESHEIYGRVTSLFLGHAPRGIAAKHYAAAPQGLLDQALDWLREQFFPSKRASEK